MKDYTKKQKILIVIGVSLFILIGSGTSSSPYQLSVK